MDVGSLSAQGGVYVPVSDAAVTLNTGIIVYKECVLRNQIVRMREAASVGLAKTASRAIETGRGGEAQYMRSPEELVTEASDPAFINFMQTVPQNANAAFREEITRALAVTYDRETRGKETALNCPYEGDVRQAITNPYTNFSWEGFGQLSDPACSPLTAYYILDDMADAATARCMEYMQEQLSYGRGYYPMFDDPNNPCSGQIVTPAVNVQENFQAILNSPIHQLESANDIGQMIGALYSGMSTQMISDNRGLAGMTQGIGGQPSFMDQLVSESSAGVRNSTLNTALTILNSAKQVETAYLSAVTSILSVLTQTSTALRNAENQCWNLIIPKVCSTTLNAQNECTDGSGITYKVATSTAGYAQGVITARVTPLVGPTTQKVTTSQNALRAIDQLLIAVSGTASLAAQRLAIQQLDTLIAQKVLHIPPDVDGPTGVVKQLSDVRSLTNTLIQDTVRAWADDPSPTVGWCNVNNPAVIDAWKSRWRK